MVHHVAVVRVSQQPLHLRLGHHPTLPGVVFLDGVLQRLVLQSNWDVLGAPPQEPHPTRAGGRVPVSSFLHLILHQGQSDVSVLELTCRQTRQQRRSVTTGPPYKLHNYTVTTDVITTNSSALTPGGRTEETSRGSRQPSSIYDVKSQVGFLQVGRVFVLVEQDQKLDVLGQLHPAAPLVVHGDGHPLPPHPSLLTDGKDVPSLPFHHHGVQGERDRDVACVCGNCEKVEVGPGTFLRAVLGRSPQQVAVHNDPWKRWRTT